MPMHACILNRAASRQLQANPGSESPAANARAFLRATLPPCRQEIFSSDAGGMQKGPQSAPILATHATSLKPTDAPGIASVQVLQREERFALSWDRYIRLNAAAERIRKVVRDDGVAKRVLDVGGFDGALALFFDAEDGYEVDVVDPETTGGSGLRIEKGDGSCPIVTAIDALEHVKPQERSAFLAELSRVAGDCVILNFPSHGTIEAQKLVLSLTGNQFIREHVEYVLPEHERVVKEMASNGFSNCGLIQHGSSSVWVSQFVLAHVSPEAARATARFLIDQPQEEAPAAPLYDLLVCRRS